jgi:1-deoxy-D-xylulose-5-phosphate reductoisomerase
MKRIIILGSTGSIGVNSLDVVAKFPERFQVVALAAGSNSERLEEQIRKFRPRMAALMSEEAAAKLRDRCRDIKVEIVSGMRGMIQIATHPEGDLVIAAIVGAAGLVPTLSAIRAKKPIALANKETMVMAGQLVTEEAKRYGVTIFPVDSEHSAIFQSMEGHRRENIRKLILTASGGPLLKTPLAKMRSVTPERALKHPNWKMGAKITIDSATLMNKGLEVIEARWLFDIAPSRIEVLIHPQSVIHSMVEYVDGSVIAQLGIPDMRAPLSYALSYPERLALELPPLDLADTAKLTFLPPDNKRFPCLGYAYEAIREGGSLPAVLNAANEEAVHAFLKKRIKFLDIGKVIRKTMDAYHPNEPKTLEHVLEADAWARKQAQYAMTKNN